MTPRDDDLPPRDLLAWLSALIAAAMLLGVGFISGREATVEEMGRAEERVAAQASRANQLQAINTRLEARLARLEAQLAARGRPAQAPPVAAPAPQAPPAKEARPVAPTRPAPFPTSGASPPAPPASPPPQEPAGEAGMLQKGRSREVLGGLARLTLEQVGGSPRQALILVSIPGKGEGRKALYAGSSVTFSAGGRAWSLLVDKIYLTSASYRLRPAPEGG